MGDPVSLPVQAPGAVTAGALVPETASPADGGINVHIAGAAANPTPVAAHLASGALPAAGAYTTQTAWTIEAGTTEITATITYTRGAAAGFPRFRPLWTTAGGEAQGTVLDGTIDTSAAPLGRQSLYLEEVNGPTPSSGAAITFTLSFGVREAAPGATAFRLEACEAGVTGTPGTCAIALSGTKQ